MTDTQLPGNGRPSTAATGTCLWVSNLPKGQQAKAADLKQLFSHHGRVLSTKIVVSAKYAREQQFGFVILASREDADRCVKHLNNTEFLGSRILVNEKQPTPRRVRDKLPSSSIITNSTPVTTLAHTTIPTPATASAPATAPAIAPEPETSSLSALLTVPTSSSAPPSSNKISPILLDAAVASHLSHPDALALVNGKDTRGIPTRPASRTPSQHRSALETTPPRSASPSPQPVRADDLRYLLLARRQSSTTTMTKTTAPAAVTTTSSRLPSALREIGSEDHRMAQKAPRLSSVKRLARMQDAIRRQQEELELQRMRLRWERDWAAEEERRILDEQLAYRRMREELELQLRLEHEELRRYSRHGSRHSRNTRSRSRTRSPSRSRTSERRWGHRRSSRRSSRSTDRGLSSLGRSGYRDQSPLDQPLNNYNYYQGHQHHGERRSRSPRRDYQHHQEQQQQQPQQNRPPPMFLGAGHAFGHLASSSAATCRLP